MSPTAADTRPPLCTSCAHYVRGNEEAADLCSAATTISPVRGAAASTYCAVMRLPGRECGPAGGLHRRQSDGRCLFCDRAQQLKPGCTKQRWRVCREHFMVTCPACGHEAFWMEGLKSGNHYACFSLACNWRDAIPPNSSRMNHDDLCHDKNRRVVKVGDTIRINTCGSLAGDYSVTRGANGELQIGGHDLFGFYPGTYEVLPNAGGRELIDLANDAGNPAYSAAGRPADAQREPTEPDEGKPPQPRTASAGTEPEGAGGYPAGVRRMAGGAGAEMQ